MDITICRDSSSSPSPPSTGLLEWLKKEGVEDKDIKVTFQQTGKVVASVDIKQGEPIISLPAAIAINAKTSSAIKSKISAEKLKTGEIGMSALMLLAEKLAGEKSKYYEYISSLPTKVPGILSWTREELEMLYKSTTRRIQSQVAAIEQDVQVIIDNGVFPEGFDKEAFLWALGTVKSRSFYVQGLGNTIIIPGMDSITFDPFSTAEPVYQGGGLFGKGGIKVLADRSYQAGEEVFISYGLKSSAECLEDHGIVPDLIEDDCSCEMMLEIEESDRFSGDKFNILEQEMLDSRLKIDLEADSSLEFGICDFSSSTFLSFIIRLYFLIHVQIQCLCSFLDSSPLKAKMLSFLKHALQILFGIS